MNPQLARAILGIEPDESDISIIRDAIDDKIFEHATYFLNRAFLPKLTAVRIKRLEELIAVKDALIGEEADATYTQSEIVTFSEKSGDLKNLISSYNEVESLIKQALIRAESPKAVIRAYEIWLHIFSAYAVRFTEIYPMNAFAKEADPAVKISEQVNMMEMLEELHSDSSEKPLLHLEYSRLKKLSN